MSHWGRVCIKIRLASRSKGKGKSGGFRVITYLLSKTEEGTDVYLITFYSKLEESRIETEVLVKMVSDL